MEEIKKNPYKIICDFYERTYPKIGGYVFEILSLVPCSLIIDDLDFFSTKIRTNMNVFFLAESGSAKSSICSEFAKISYSPIEGRSYTPAELENEAIRKKFFTLIIEDYATMSMDERTNKIIEGAIGDEKVIDRHTTKKDVREHIEAVALLCGVPNDLNYRLTTGLLSRVICIAKAHRDKEHSDIGKHIIKNAGNKIECEIPLEKIKDYYKLLFDIQNNAGEELQRVNGFFISENIRDRIWKVWDEETKKFRKIAPFNFFRELHDGIRILVSYAFLNYFNRKINNGILEVTEEDCEIAIKLMKRNLNKKFRIYAWEKLGGSIDNMKIFKENIGEK